MTEQRLPARAFGVRMATLKGTIWWAELTESQTYDDCMDPTFWRDVVHKVAPNGILDEIEVTKLDTMSKRKYLIIGIGSGFIKLALIEQAGAAIAPDLKKESPLQVRWNPGKKGHEVIRPEGAGLLTVMAGPFQTKAAAVDWVTDHLAKMAA